MKRSLSKQNKKNVYKKKLKKDLLKYKQTTKEKLAKILYGEMKMKKIKVFFLCGFSSTKKQTTLGAFFTVLSFMVTFFMFCCVKQSLIFFSVIFFFYNLI